MINKFKLSGLTCAACEKLSAKRINKISGVAATMVDKDSGLAEITADREISLIEVQDALQGTEYQAEIIN